MSNSEEIHATFLPAVATQQAVLTAPLFSLLENTSQSTPEQVSNSDYKVEMKKHQYDALHKAMRTIKPI